MKIDLAIHSSDSSELYLDFWPIVSKIWVKKFNVKPILIYIDNDLNKSIVNDYGEIIRIKPIPNEPINLQTQLARFWYTINYPELSSIISDIDMLPISSKYFATNLIGCNESSYIHLNPCINEYGRLPACYHVAKGRVFKEVLEINDNWHDFYFKVKELGSKICEKENLPIWFIDECYTSFKVLNYNNDIDISLIPRVGGASGFRIDRSGWVYNKHLFKYDYYIDLHSIRPLSNHKIEVLEIADLILTSEGHELSLIKLYYAEFLYSISRLFVKITSKFFLWAKR